MRGRARIRVLASCQASDACKERPSTGNGLITLANPSQSLKQNSVSAAPSPAVFSPEANLAPDPRLLHARGYSGGYGESPSIRPEKNHKGRSPRPYRQSKWDNSGSGAQGGKKCGVDKSGSTPALPSEADWEMVQARGKALADVFAGVTPCRYSPASWSSSWKSLCQSPKQPLAA